MPTISRTGYSLDEMLGHRPGDVLQGPDTDRDAVADVARQLNAGRSFKAELLNYTKQGEPYWVLFQITPIRNANGDVEPMANGYQQSGEVDARVELTEGVLAFEGPARRVHVWGTPHLPRPIAMPTGPSVLEAPYRRSDRRHVLQVLTRTGWLARTVDLA